jgi:hypothetical protein
MYAQILGTEVDRKAHLLALDESYIISKFIVKPSRSGYIPFSVGLVWSYIHIKPEVASLV